jgi:aspartyl aminopeptidase
MDKRINALADYLDSAHSVFHAVEGLRQQLEAHGYQRLLERDAWNLVPGGKYYLIRGGSAVMAFRIPAGAPAGFLMSASHADRPTFKFKENGALATAYAKLAVERYGGMLIAPWLDRPLSLAGRVMVETEQGVESRLVDIDRDLLLIPNVAIHMNRQANEGYKWNPAVDTLPLMGSKDTASKLMPLLEEAAGGKILGHDLYLYVRQKAAVWGIEEEFISAPALDDLECAWCCTQGFLEAKESESIPVLCVFDSEEVGSSSLQGAASNLLESLLRRICDGLNLDFGRMLAQSFMVSADNAHALHPNHPELADSANAPVLGKGIAIKYNANQRYTTDGVSAALFRKVCAKAGSSVQTYCNRADIAGGSTLGNISLGHVSVPSVDIGLPQLAMHSCYETATVADAVGLMDAMTVYFGSTLTVDGESWSLA